MPTATIPRQLPREVFRTHLHPLLDRAGLKWVALSAGEGYGKTTFMAQWVSLKTTPVVWVSLQPYSHDLHALQTLLEIRLPGSGPELEERLSGVTLVIDHTEHLDPAQWAFLGQLVRDSPADALLMTAGPTPPPGEFQRLLEAGQALLLEATDLQFREHETFLLLKKQVPDPEIPLVHQTLQGWPMGVALARSGTRPLRDPHLLMLDLLERLPPELSRPLPGAAVLEVWDDAGAQQLGLDLPPGWVNSLMAAGCPLSQEVHGPVRPHPVLRDTLSRLLKNQPEWHRDLHHRASTLATLQGNVLQAFEHALQGGNLELALQHASRLVPAWMAAGRWSRIEQVLRPLPVQHLSADLQLALARALSVEGVTPEADLLYSRLFAAGHLEYDDHLLMAGHRLDQGQPAEALILARAAFGQARDPGERCHALRAVATCALALGSGQDVLPAVGSEIQLARLEQRKGDLLLLLHTEGQLQAAEGNWGTALHVLTEAEHLATLLDLPRARISVGLERARVLTLSGQGAQALKVLDPLLGPTELHLPQKLCWIYVRRAEAHCARQDVVQARRCITTGLQLCEGNPPEHPQLRWWLGYFQGLTHHQLGELPLLAEQVRGLQLQAQEDMPGQTPPELSLLHGLLSWHQQDPAAVEHLQRAKQHLPHHPLVGLYLAAAHTRFGEASASDVQGVLEVLDHMATDTLLQQEAPHLQEVYRCWVERRWHPERFSPHLASPQTLPDEASWTLHLHTFGTFQVQLGQQVVPIKLRKGQEVLLWLCWSGRSTLTELLEGIWGGDWGKRERKYFHVALAELRRELGEKLQGRPAIEFDGCNYQISPLLRVQVDARDLLTLQPSSDPEQLAAGLRLCQGPFCPGHNRPWLEDLREEIHLAMTELALQVGEVYSYTRSELALLAYQTALHLDPTLEEAHRGLVRVLQHTGQYREAILAQQRFEQQLQLEWQLDRHARIPPTRKAP